MANIKSAKKDIRKSQRARLRNISYRSMLRTHIKKVRVALGNGDAENAQAAYKALEPLLDRSVNKGFFHRNKVARYKKRLSARVYALVKPAPVAT